MSTELSFVTAIYPTVGETIQSSHETAFQFTVHTAIFETFCSTFRSTGINANLSTNVSSLLLAFTSTSDEAFWPTFIATCYCSYLPTNEYAIRASIGTTQSTAFVGSISAIRPAHVLAQPRP
jgi:hypothetical protein